MERQNTEKIKQFFSLNCTKCYFSVTKYLSVCKLVKLKRSIKHGFPRLE